MIAAIEIYNKPTFRYRDETFVILLLNAWELLLKAILSKNRRSIYFPKRRCQPYRTLAIADTLNRTQDLFPKDINHAAVSENIRLLLMYRDNAIHFYNKPGFGVLVYALAQTNILNYKDLLERIFGMDLSRDITVRLLPLALAPPVDPLAFIQRPVDSKGKVSHAVTEFIAALRKSVERLKEEGADTGRLLTVFKVKLESTKKLEQADLVVSVGTAVTSDGPAMVERRVDPNISHPLRQKDIVGQLALLHGREVTSFVVQAIVWKYNIKGNIQYCWRASENILTKYSRDFITWLKSISADDMDTALAEYRQHLRTLQGRKGQSNSRHQGSESA